MRDFVCISLIVLSMALLEAAVGPHAPALRSALGTLAMLGAGVPLLGGVRRPYLVVAAALLVGSASTLAPPARHFGIAAALACATLSLPAERRATAATSAFATFGFAIFVTLRDHLTLWPFVTTWSERASTAAAALAGNPVRLGPTYAGTWIAVLLGIVFLARAAVAGRLRLGAAALAVVLVALAPVAWLALGRWSDVRGLHFLGWRIVLFALFLPALALFLRTHPAAPAAPVNARRRPIVATLLVCTGLVFLTWNGHIPARPVRLLIDTRGSFGMQPLEWGRYGPEAGSGASLATLPALVEAHGFTCTLHDTTLDRALLAAHDVLLVMNPTRTLATDEHRAVWDFVRGGGGLLVLGDHTNIQDTMEPLNALLEPCGFQVEFDSAIPLVERWSWFGCMRVHPHPITRGLQDESQIKVSVGASLHLPATALPLLGGRDAFSDPGNWMNAAGAYLGNMRYDPGETLGDLPLAGTCTYGRGRVVVFGDTSPFQRSAVAHTHRFVLRVLTYLAGPRAGVPPFAVRLAGGIVLLAGTVLLAPPSALAWLIVAAALASAWLVGLDHLAVVDPPPGRHGDIAWLDVAHGNRVDVHAGRDDGIGGLVDHLWRQGYVPLVMHRMNLQELEQGRMFVTVAPAFPFSASERRALGRFVQSGGLLVVATGFEERRGARDLLGDFGYAIGRTPIGAAHQSVTHLDEQRVVMHESWPVERPEGHGEVWVECWGYPLVVFERIGSGGLLVIGDSRFLCDVKLESTETFVEANIDFLRHALAIAQPRSTGGTP